MAKKYQILGLLRFLAAMTVVLDHAGYYTRRPWLKRRVLPWPFSRGGGAIFIISPISVADSSRFHKTL